ncbi:MAG: imidazoleglycerol-phosphate dehydratase HisB [Candidatus Heimdallarchaeota archaeon]|nr:imidazoleglycerol-phosphate dehydratase HisB [Candidatus Heimdallarchaeota archaeon]
MRSTRIERITKEVNILLEINLDGQGNSTVTTGIKFFDHLLTTLAKHGLFDLKLMAEGDLLHHTIEDVALVLGEAFTELLAQKKGIRRFGSAYVPMDEALARATIDFSGRPFFRLNLQLEQVEIEDMKSEDIQHFFQSFALAAQANLHLTVLYGENEHHKIEAGMKALALAIREAIAYEARLKDQIPSAKGVL